MCRVTVYRVRSERRVGTAKKKRWRQRQIRHTWGRGEKPETILKTSSPVDDTTIRRYNILPNFSFLARRLKFPSSPKIYRHPYGFTGPKSSCKKQCRNPTVLLVLSDFWCLGGMDNGPFCRGLIAPGNLAAPDVGGRNLL